MRTLSCIIAVGSCLLGTSRVVSACSCELAPTALAELRRAAFVFAGTVIEIDEQATEVDFSGDKVEIPLLFTKFEVARSWKGIDGEETTILTEAGMGTNCGYSFQLGVEYLVYGYVWAHPYDSSDEEKYLQTNACFRTKPLGEATEDLEALGEPSFTLIKPTLWGQIKTLFR